VSLFKPPSRSLIVAIRAKRSEIFSAIVLSIARNVV